MPQPGGQLVFQMRNEEGNFFQRIQDLKCELSGLHPIWCPLVIQEDTRTPLIENQVPRQPVGHTVAAEGQAISPRYVCLSKSSMSGLDGLHH